MPKKKGKVNKLARMSDDERARYLQHRADIEEEARRRKRELIARFIKNKLEKEESFSRTNTAKLNQEWRFILRKIKQKQMALDIQGMCVTFNFMMDRKSRLISTLLLAIEDSDDQHRRAFQAHAETLAHFLNIGTKRLDKIQSEYDYQKNSLLENWYKEENEITENQEQAEFKLNLITFIQDTEFQEYKKKTDVERATANNDARIEHEELMRSLWRPKQLEIEFYCTQLREVYNSFLEKHNPIINHYQILREKDEFYQRDIAKNEVLIQQGTEMLLHLQREWVRTTRTTNSKLQRMNSHKEELSKKYWQLKRDTNNNNNRASSKLEVMVNASQDAIMRLEEVREKLNKIMQITEICKKYEQDDDKTYASEMEEEYKVPLDFENLDSSMMAECTEYSKLDKFLLKVNRVKVQTICLKAEKAKLCRDNEQLKLYIKKYLTDLALKDGKSRPLSVKLQSGTQKIDAAGKILNRPVTCIEGALSNAVMHERRMRILHKKNKETGGIRSYPRTQCWMEPA